MKSDMNLHLDVNDTQPPPVLASYGNDEIPVGIKNPDQDVVESPGRLSKRGGNDDLPVGGGSKNTMLDEFPPGRIFYKTIRDSLP